jgi:hypothetical protein
MATVIFVGLPFFAYHYNVEDVKFLTGHVFRFHWFALPVFRFGAISTDTRRFVLSTVIDPYSKFTRGISYGSPPERKTYF